MRKEMNEQMVYYIPVSGRPARETLDREQAAALSRGETVILAQPDDNGQPVRLAADGAADSLGIPCIRLFDNGGRCSRSALRAALKALDPRLSFGQLELVSDLYVFPQEGFLENITEHAASLDPCICPGLEGADLSGLGVTATLIYSPEPRQYELHLLGDDPMKVVDAFAPAKKMVAEVCAKQGMRPFFAPKIDSFASSGLVMRLLKVEQREDDVWQAALLGVYEHAKAMTMASCNQVNSYKRITPKHVTKGQRIPCLLRCTLDDDRNAIVKWNREQGEITFYLADNYCNAYLALAANLGMLQYGLAQYGGQKQEDRWQAFLSSTERMPNSLAVAAGLWEKSEFAQQVCGAWLAQRLYHDALLEWEEYCDIAHPWELMRGVRYEGQ